MKKCLTFLCLGLFLISCGDDIPKSTTSLNEAEFSKVASLIKSSLIGMIFSNGFVTGSITSEYSCGDSGNITATGDAKFDLNESTYTGTGELDAVFNYNTCQVTPSGALTSITLTGSYDYSANFKFAGENNQTGGANIIGTLNVEGVQAGNGVCGIYLTSTAPDNELSGSVCGRSVTKEDFN